MPTQEDYAAIFAAQNSPEALVDAMRETVDRANYLARQLATHDIEVVYDVNNLQTGPRVTTETIDLLVKKVL